MVLILLYSIGLFTTTISAKGIAISSIFGLILIFVIVKMLISLKDTAPLLVLNKEGIISRVTAMSQAAGLILWEDISDMSVNKMGGDTLITLVVNKPDHYTPIIRKKLSAIAVNGANDAEGNLLIYLTASALDLNAQELFGEITRYKKGINNVKSL
jgi:hypothetical protein